MKKIIALLMTVLMMVGVLASCGGGNTTDYSSLTIVDMGLDKEYYGIAFRTGSDMTRKVEDITLELIKEGKFTELSQKYGVESMLTEAEYTPKADACETSSDWEYIKAKSL